MIDLGALGGGESGRSGGVDINDVGHIVGFSTHAGPGLRGFIYRDGQMQDMGTLGGERVTVFAINNSDQAVGGAADAQGRERAFLFCDDELHDLNALIEGGDLVDLQSATAITDDGVILAAGIDARSGKRGHYLLRPIVPARAAPMPKQSVDPQPSFSAPRIRFRGPQAWALAQ